MYAELGNLRMFFTDEGAGDPAILFVHGYACDSHDWMWQIPHFVGAYRTIAVDLRGHGRTSVPDGPFDPLTLSEDLAALINEIDCGPVVAIGHSLGGVLVNVLAVEHPELVQAVIGVDPAYLVPNELRPIMVEMLDAMRDDPVATAQALGSASYTAASPVNLRSWHLRRIAGMPPQVLQDVFVAMTVGPKAMTFRSDVEEYLRRRSCPVLSFFTEPSRADLESELFVDPRSRTVVWEGSGHFLHQEKPEEFNYMVDTWLTSLGPLTSV